MKCVVNPFELCLYYCLLLSLVFWALYKLYEAQNDLIFSKDPLILSNLRGISTGWNFLNRPKDISDNEWSCWTYYVQTSGLYVIFQFIISEILREYTSTIKYWYILSSLLEISFNMGVSTVLLFLIQPLIYFTLLLCGVNRTVIWLWSLTLLLLNHMFLWRLLDFENSSREKLNLQTFSLGWIVLRCISYCFDYIEKQENDANSEVRNDQDNVLQIIIDFLSYVLYFPVLYIGPMILYGEFEKSFQNKKESLCVRLRRFAVDIVLFSIYSLMFEMALHFMYFTAMTDDIQLIKLLPSAALLGGGLWMSFTFHAKYVILYGTSSAFARLDHVESPPTPRCIARIHVYSNMWRYFDVGLYKFLVKYIYMPCYSKLRQYQILSEHICKQIATLSIFAFIIFWHGNESSIIIWCVLNFVALFMEYFVKVFSTTELYKNLKEKILKTDAMEVRFISVLCAPLLALSSISNFYFFGGPEVGYLYVELLPWPAPHNFLLLSLVLYCCCQVSISLLDVPSRTDRRYSRIKAVR